MAAWWAAALRCLGVGTGYPVPGIAESDGQSPFAEPAGLPWRAAAPCPPARWVLPGRAAWSCPRPRPGRDAGWVAGACPCLRFGCPAAACPDGGCAALADVDRSRAGLPWPFTPGMAAPPAGACEVLCAAAATLKRYRLYCCISWMSLVPYPGSVAYTPVSAAAKAFGWRRFAMALVK